MRRLVCRSVFLNHGPDAITRRAIPICAHTMRRQASHTGLTTGSASASVCRSNRRRPVSRSESWAGRDYASGNTYLRTYNAAPSIAYRLNDWISVGVGVQIQYAKASLQHGVSALIPGVGVIPFGDAVLQGDGWSYGMTAGVTLTPTPTTTVGLGYRSGLNQKLSGTLLTPLGVAVANTTVDLPDTVSLGVRQRLDAQWTLLGTAEWTNWSRIGTSNVTANGRVAATLPFEYRDGWFFSGGVEYQANDRLTLRTGVAYEISPIDDRGRTPLIPDNNR